MKKIINFFPTITLLVIFIVWTILVKTIDVTYISNVGYLGFSHFNFTVNNFVLDFGRTSLFDKLTDVGLYLSIAVVLTFAVIGIVEWVKRKSIKKVDQILFVLLATYLIAVVSYLIFEINKINYSPLSTAEELKSSYPSSHVLAFSVFFITGVLALFEYVKVNKIIKICSISFVSILVCLYAFARLLSGQHYFSDVIGSILLSMSIIAFYINFKSALASKVSEEE